MLKYLGRAGTFLSGEAALYCPKLKSICVETFSPWLCEHGACRGRTTSTVKYQEVSRAAVIVGIFSKPSLFSELCRRAVCTMHTLCVSQ